MRSRRIFWTLFSIVGGLLGALPAHGDDWAQFRKDAEHSGASKDPVKLPLAEIWSWTPSNFVPRLNHAAVFHGQIFFTSNEGRQRYLVSANAKTGVVAWKQPLTSEHITNPVTDGIGPSVSKGGIVFIYDMMMLPKLLYDGMPGDQFETALNDRVFGDDVDQREKLRASLVHYARGYFGLLPGLPDPPPGLKIKRVNDVLTFNGSIPTVRHPLGGQPQIGRLSVMVAFRSSPNVVIRTFSAVDGKPGPFVAIEPWLNNEVVNYTALLHPPLQHGFAGLPASDLVFPEGVGLGPPVLIGDRLIASTTASALVDWSPTNGLRQSGVQHTLVHHPVPGWDPAYTPLAALNGYPPLVLPCGILLGDDQRHRFLTLLSTQTGVNGWHLDVRGALGVPATDGSRVYMGILGSGATKALVCMDPSSGSVYWRYAPAGTPDDPQHVERGRWMASTFKVDENSRRIPLGHRKVQLHTQKGEPLQFEDRSYSMVIPDTWSGSGPGEFSFSHAPKGWENNPGLAVTQDSVYGIVAQNVVALERDTGTPRWRVPLEPGFWAGSLILSGEHLFLCVSKGPGGRQPVGISTPFDQHKLVALRVKDGKKVWEEPVNAAGALIAANGMVFLANGTLHAYGPAERTFRMATDSGNKEDYRLHSLPAEPVDGAEEELAPGRGLKPTADEAQPVLPNLGPSHREVADAGVLRLSAGDPVEQLLNRAKTRRELLPDLPLLVSLDPWTPTRDGWLPVSSEPALGEAWNAHYAELCGKVAAAAHPEYLEVLPEVNAYLVRNMDRARQLHTLLQTVTEAVHAASPQTRVVVSLNAEVLNGSYSRGDYRPFGKLPAADSRTVAPSLALAGAADVVGLTAYPQSGAVRAAEVPSSYLLSIRMEFGAKPVLVTRLATVVDEAQEPKTPGPQREQAAFLGRLIQNCYWLDAPLVAYPELVSAGKSAPIALRKADGERSALGVWQHVLRWKRVEKLTLLKTPKEEKSPAEPE